MIGARARNVGVPDARDAHGAKMYPYSNHALLEQENQEFWQLNRVIKTKVQ
jgi:hypothetical protein